jgi:hypothetical protein
VPIQHYVKYYCIIFMKCRVNSKEESYRGALSPILGFIPMQYNTSLPSVMFGIWLVGGTLTSKNVLFRIKPMASAADNWRNQGSGLCEHLRGVGRIMV